MRGAILTFLVLFGHSGPLWAEEALPFADLSHEQEERRERAQAVVTTWASKNRGQARKELLKLYVTSSDPEFRRRLIPALEHAYFPPKGYLGVQMMSARYDQLGRLRPPAEQGPGVVLVRVAPQTPAAASGLKAGDIILKINDLPFQSDDRVDEAAKEIQRHTPNTSVALTVERDGKLLEISLKLGVLPVPSERARIQRAALVEGGGMVSTEILQQLAEFRRWLMAEIERERKNLIADRR